jgi:hypothetical protein
MVLGGHQRGTQENTHSTAKRPARRCVSAGIPRGYLSSTQGSKRGTPWYSGLSRAPKHTPDGATAGTAVVGASVGERAGVSVGAGVNNGGVGVGVNGVFGAGVGAGVGEGVGEGAGKGVGEGVVTAQTHVS